MALSLKFVILQCFVNLHTSLAFFCCYNNSIFIIIVLFDSAFGIYIYLIICTAKLLLVLTT